MTTVDNPPGGGFEQYTAEVYGWAYRLLGRHHDALDVVQDVFLRWDAQCAREAPRQPRGWLRRVTVNRAIDVRRARKGEAVSEPTAPSPVETSHSLESQVDRELLREDITAALGKLSTVQRCVLVAKVYDEMKFKEIAEEQDLALSTVKTHYMRAVRAVRDRLQRRWAGEDSI